MATGGTPPLPDLPDPNTYPDPYPSSAYQHRAPYRLGLAGQAGGNPMTPPMSMFSEGSSSASTRSSLAFNGTASSYIRTSEGQDYGSVFTGADMDRTSRGMIPSQYTADTSFGSVDGDLSLSLDHHQHLHHLMNQEDSSEHEGDDDDGEGGDVGVGLTSDDAVHLAHSASMSSIASSSRGKYVGAPVPESARWSGSSTGLGMGGGRGLSASMNDLRNQQALSADWDAVDEREEFGLTTDEETDQEGEHDFVAGMTEDTDDNDDEDDEDDDDELDADRTAAVFMAEEGLGMIIHGEGLPVDRLVIRPGEIYSFLC